MLVRNYFASTVHTSYVRIFLFYCFFVSFHLSFFLLTSFSFSFFLSLSLSPFPSFCSLCPFSFHFAFPLSFHFHLPSLSVSLSFHFLSFLLSVHLCLSFFSLLFSFFLLFLFHLFCFFHSIFHFILCLPSLFFCPTTQGKDKTGGRWGKKSFSQSQVVGPPLQPPKPRFGGGKKLSDSRPVSMMVDIEVLCDVQSRLILCSTLDSIQCIVMLWEFKFKFLRK